MKYFQCKFKKGNCEQTSWIPEKYAKKGKFLKLKDDNGWEVIDVSSAMEEAQVKERSQDHKKTRLASDI